MHAGVGKEGRRSRVVGEREETDRGSSRFETRWKDKVAQACLL